MTTHVKKLRIVNFPALEAACQTYPGMARKAALRYTASFEQTSLARSRHSDAGPRCARRRHVESGAAVLWSGAAPR